MRLGRQFGVGAAMLLMASGGCYASSTAVVAGVVRDAQGVAQMGARVEVLAAGPVSVATAFTDFSGRYRISNLVPGSYQVRASAVLFIPATRRNLRLVTGMLATVNLTLSMLSDPAAWLPTERRKADEPGDDWTWTLRSAASRPILRMLGDGEIVWVSSRVPESSRHAPIHVRTSVIGGDAGFGAGGLHTVIALDRAGAGSDVKVRTSVATRASPGRSLSTEIDAGYERATANGVSSRLVVNFASHPEMIGAGTSAGMQVLRMASARKMQLGDAVDFEAGATVYAIHTTATALTAQPFLRLTVHPGEVWAIRYMLATSRDLQGFDGLDCIETNLPVAALVSGRLRSESGNHQEIAVSRKVGGGSIQAAVYHDSIDGSAISGVGMIDSGEVTASSHVMADIDTATFRLLGPGYSATGMRVSVAEALTPSLSASLEYELGVALSARNTEFEGLTEVSGGLEPDNAEAFTAAVKGRILRTGTRVRASYRYQPQHLVTAVDPYAQGADQGFLSLYVRQAMRWGSKLPPGLEATIDVTNLLAEGYQPFLSADGRTLFLAESPRTIQAGLSFTF